MNVKFTDNAFTDFSYWVKNDKKKASRIIEIIKDIERNPFDGIGKPERLKYNLKEYYSRRIDRENRLMYKVENEDIIILSCRYHYE